MPDSEPVPTQSHYPQIGPVWLLLKCQVHYLRCAAKSALWRRPFLSALVAVATPWRVRGDVVTAAFGIGGCCCCPWFSFVFVGHGRCSLLLLLALLTIGGYLTSFDHSLMSGDQHISTNFASSSVSAVFAPCHHLPMKAQRCRAKMASEKQDQIKGPDDMRNGTCFGCA